MEERELHESGGAAVAEQEKDWHPKYKGGCVKCGGKERPHWAFGLCRACYSLAYYRRHRPEFLKLRRERERKLREKRGQIRKRRS